MNKESKQGGSQMRALVVNVVDAELSPSVNTEKRLVDDMYYVTDRGPIAIAYLLKPEHHNEVQNLLKLIRLRRRSLRKYEYEILANTFREFRI